MTVTQIATLMNDVTKELVGESAVVAEDLSNVVDIGKTILGATDVDNYVKSLVNHIGKVIFVNRPYRGSAPSVLMDAWEYGSVLEKISGELPDVSESDTWKLTDATSYDPNIFKKPTVSMKLFNSRVTFECDVSITERQVKESFSSPTQLNAFVGMIENDVEKSMTLKIDSLVMRTINNFIGRTIASEITSPAAANTWIDSDLAAHSGMKAVNLLKLYNDNVIGTGGTPIGKDKALVNADFLKFAAHTMLLYKNRMGRMSKLFNIGGKARFTPVDVLHTIFLADFSTACDTYLQSSTFHNEFVALPKHETIPYWQGSGTDYHIDNVSKVKITTDTNKSIDVDGVIGVMFDRDALGVCNLERRVQTHFNPKGEFWNNFYKFEAGYFNDLNENFVVFYIN